MRVERTLMQTLTSQLSSAVMQTLASQLSCNSCSSLTGVWELRELSCKLSLLNSRQLSCNSCSRLTEAWELRKLSCKLSLLNSHQLSCNSCSRLTRAWELRRPALQIIVDQSCRSYTVLQVHNYPIQKMWSELPVIDRCPAVICSAVRLSNKLLLLNSHQLSCNSCSRLTRARELRRLSYKLSPTLILVWAGLKIHWPFHW
jgi:hypothetical protein